MTADTYDPILGLILQATGNNNNTWGTTNNNSCISPAARGIAGINSFSSTGGTVDLSGSPPPAALRQDIDHIQFIGGTLTSDLTIIVPAISKTWWFLNGTSGAFQVFVKTPSGVSPNGLVQLPVGKQILVMGDGGGNIFRHDRELIGNLIHHAGTGAPFGSMLCNGASLVRTEFPDLFSKIGTTWGAADGTHFTLPNFQDTGRFLRAGGGSGPAVGTYQANQNQAHSHAVTGAPSVGSLGTDVQGSHSHGYSDPTHTHSYTSPTPGGNNGSGGVVQATTTGATTGAAGIGITISAAGAHNHNVTGAPGLGSLGTASSGGSEARPESAAVLICIRY